MTLPRSKLFAYQREKMIPRMVHDKRTAAFVRMGFGKTIGTLTSLVDLGMPRTLVVAPARVVEMDVWGAEARRWEHTKGILTSALDGDPKRRINQLNNFPGDLETISYELFPWLSETVDLEQRYGAIVFDELSKMKTPGATRFKRMRKRSMEIPIRFGLTGTPKGNHLLDLWGEMFAVAGEAPLGSSFVSFRSRYFIPIDTGGPRGSEMWSPVHEAQEMITERIKPWSFSLAPGEAPPLPSLNYNLIEVPLPSRVRAQINELTQDLRTQLDSGTELLALSSGVRATRARQLASGAVYTDLAGTWEPVHTLKLEALEEVLEGAQGEPVLCFYWYKHEKERIKQRFPWAKEISKENLELWNEGKVELLLAHPASAGHGLNLQFGGSTIVWFTLPWSWEMFSQSNARLARHGQVDPFVMVHVLLAGECDHAVLSALREKERTEQQLIDAVTI